MGSGPKSPNNEFVENGRKSQSEYREKILVDSVKGKELLMHRYKKHPRICLNNMINNMELSLFTVVFLQPFSLFSLFFLFIRRFFLASLFVLYTVVFVSFSLSTCESGVGSFSVPFRPSLNLLLLAVRLLIYCSGITSTLMQLESQLGSI